MIKKFYIVQTTGTCLHYINFEDFKREQDEAKSIHPQIASGFFSAIIAFCDNSSERNIAEGSKICKLAWKQMDLYFFNLEEYYFIIEADNKNMNLDDEDWKNIFNYISEIFSLMMKNGQINATSGLIPDFSDFEHNTREYIAKVLRRSLLKGLRAK